MYDLYRGRAIVVVVLRRYNIHYARGLGWRRLSSDRAHRFGAPSAQAADSVADVSKAPFIYIYIYVYKLAPWLTRHIYIQYNYYIILWYTA